MAQDDWPFQKLPGNAADCFIQWKGTKVCMDFYCPCGAHGHLDAWHAYKVKCVDCGRVFELGTQVLIREVEGDDRAVLTDNEDGDRWKE